MTEETGNGPDEGVLWPGYELSTGHTTLLRACGHSPHHPYEVNRIAVEQGRFPPKCPHGRTSRSGSWRSPFARQALHPAHGLHLAMVTHNNTGEGVRRQTTQGGQGDAWRKMWWKTECITRHSRPPDHGFNTIASSSSSKRLCIARRASYPTPCTERRPKPTLSPSLHVRSSHTTVL